MYLQILSDSHIYYNLTHYENFTIYRYSGNKTCTRVFYYQNTIRLSSATLAS